ncbi:MAG: UDP-N-acetylmuramoyl-L-alanine--D-glutamate ligase [Deferribacteres bacterium]|nr:UDP-N-acetylmuramoyl-L-alanine--D-glutamate ligase [Deferribacteres bacterium]
MTDTFKDMNILVVGLARSGIGAANLLSALGARVTVTDSKPRDLLQDGIRRLAPSVRVITGRDARGIFDESGMIVISPGVPADISPLSRARDKGVPVIGELELAWRVIQRPFIAVTGTNGKSTVTTLVGLMLKESGFSAVTGGNIGNALTEEIYSGFRVHGSGFTVQGSRFRALDYIVAEVSSFQLESIETFRPKIAAILNITPDHLDRYSGMEDYINAKARIFENQAPEDSLILNADDPELRRLESERLRARGRGPRIFHFSRQGEVEGVYCKDGVLYCNLHDKGVLPYAPAGFPLLGIDEIRIKGTHNLENAMAASLCALLAGCSQEAVREVLKRFPGLEHRLEPVGEINGVRFINDSKGTNTGAVAGSLKGLENVILIMGGTDKGGDFSSLRELVRTKVKCLILMGEAGEKIFRALGGETETHMVAGLAEAVELSLSRASSGDVVLLSPGCASFDMFEDFADRGRKFKEAVKGVMEP